MTESLPNNRSRYHHGDLRVSLLDAATSLIRDEGVEGLSMRKLADRVGVSRTAAYHHFADKRALLCALAEEGFDRFAQALDRALEKPTERPLRVFLRAYLDFALAEPERYNLMFGASLWKDGDASDSLRATAHTSFRRLRSRLEGWQKTGVLTDREDPLRLSQVTWSTLHGLARMLIDGIYLDTQHLDELLDVAEHCFAHPEKASGVSADGDSYTN